MASVDCNFDREFVFEPGDTALLAIDMQRDFLDEEGYVAAACCVCAVFRRAMSRRCWARISR